MVVGQLGKIMDKKLKEKFKKCQLLVMDFDGVMTDNSVYLDSHGNELVRCNRSDGLGLSILRRYTSVKAVILSGEKNGVVAARAKKLKLECYQGKIDKDIVLKKIISSKKINHEDVCFMGNDINDLSCFPIVGLPIAVKNSCNQLKKMAKYITQTPGGFGAVREVCDLILEAKDIRAN
jgi:3-deoxy-D-manno-octulosonate 8-phosphate phosphatase (KDO 8-P phosphatase)